jgi:hypothetical protein
MFPVRYELNSYINLLRNSVFKGLIWGSITSFSAVCSNEPDSVRIIGFGFRHKPFLHSYNNCISLQILISTDSFSVPDMLFGVLLNRKTCYSRWPPRMQTIRKHLYSLLPHPVPKLSSGSSNYCYSDLILFR